MQLGISSYTFGWAVGVRGHEPARPLDEHGLLDKCRAHGVKLLQIGDNLPLHTFDAARLDQLAERAAARRCATRSRRAPLDAGTRRRIRAIARRLDAKLIRFVIDDADYHPKPEAVTAILRESRTVAGRPDARHREPRSFPAATLREHDRGGGRRSHRRVPRHRQLARRGRRDRGRGCDARAAHLESAHQGFSHRARAAPDGLSPSPAARRAAAFSMCRTAETTRSFDRADTAILELWTPPEPT